jgi:hypothetical protein
MTSCYVSFRIAPGQRIGIVGCRLGGDAHQPVLRFYDVRRGRITIGDDVRLDLRNCPGTSNSSAGRAPLLGYDLEHPARQRVIDDHALQRTARACMPSDSRRCLAATMPVASGVQAVRSAAVFPRWRSIRGSCVDEGDVELVARQKC